MFEKNIDWSPLGTWPTCGPGLCPDQESEQQPSVRDAQPTESHQSGLFILPFNYVGIVVNKISIKNESICSKTNWSVHSYFSMRVIVLVDKWLINSKIGCSYFFFFIFLLHSLVAMLMR